MGLGHHRSPELSIRAAVLPAFKLLRHLTARAAAGIHHELMVLALPPRRTLFQVAETLAIALAGGVAFAWLKLPAGLVSGSVLAVATAALLGRPMRMPLENSARVCYIIVGILLGTAVMLQTLRGVTTGRSSIALFMVGSLTMMLATSSYLRIVHRWDPLSALMGASPGSMAQVIALSTELGGDLRAIAIVQTVRVLLLVVGLPSGLALFGLVVPPVANVRGTCGLFGARPDAAARRGRDSFRGAVLQAAVSGRAIVRRHGGLWPVARHGRHSRGAAVVARLEAGSDRAGRFVGSRFTNTTFRMLLGFLGAAFGSFAVAMTVATSFVLLVLHFYSFQVANVAIAFAPGAQDTMMVLALALHLDPVYVGAHHLARFLVVTFALAAGARRLGTPKARGMISAWLCGSAPGAGVRPGGPAACGRGPSTPSQTAASPG